MKKVLSLILVFVLSVCLCACRNTCNCCKSCTCCNENTQSTEPSATVDLSQAQQSAALQEARNLYTEAYAYDIQDGVVDGTTDNGTTAITDSNYVVISGIPTYTYSNRGCTVHFDGTNWSVAEN